MSQSFSNMRALLLLPLVAGALGGCASGNVPYDPHGYLDRRDSIELTAGDANASNIAMQMIDPWPVYAGNKNFAYNGQRVQAAVQRYRNNEVTPPRGIAASAVYGAAGNNSSSGGANNTGPVGPTVTQVK
jgi:hypothetical protein